MKKKLLSLFLTLALIIGLCPVMPETAWADPGSGISGSLQYEFTGENYFYVPVGVEDYLVNVINVSGVDATYDDISIRGIVAGEKGGTPDAKVPTGFPGDYYPAQPGNTSKPVNCTQASSDLISADIEKLDTGKYGVKVTTDPSLWDGETNTGKVYFVIVMLGIGDDKVQFIYVPVYLPIGLDMDFSWDPEQAATPHGYKLIACDEDSTYETSLIGTATLNADGRIPFDEEELDELNITYGYKLYDYGSTPLEDDIYLTNDQLTDDQVAMTGLNIQVATKTTSGITTCEAVSSSIASSAAINKVSASVTASRMIGSALRSGDYRLVVTATLKKGDTLVGQFESSVKEEKVFSKASTEKTDIHVGVVTRTRSLDFKKAFTYLDKDGITQTFDPTNPTEIPFTVEGWAYEPGEGTTPDKLLLELINFNISAEDDIGINLRKDTNIFIANTMEARVDDPDFYPYIKLNKDSGQVAAINGGNGTYNINFYGSGGINFMDTSGVEKFYGVSGKDVSVYGSWAWLSGDGVSPYRPDFTSSLKFDFTDGSNSSAYNIKPFVTSGDLLFDSIHLDIPASLSTVGGDFIFDGGEILIPTATSADSLFEVTGDIKVRDSLDIQAIGIDSYYGAELIEKLTGTSEPTFKTGKTIKSCKLTGTFSEAYADSFSSSYTGAALVYTPKITLEGAENGIPVVNGKKNKLTFKVKATNVDFSEKYTDDVVPTRYQGYSSLPYDDMAKLTYDFKFFLIGDGTNPGVGLLAEDPVPVFSNIDETGSGDLCIELDLTSTPLPTIGEEVTVDTSVSGTGKYIVDGIYYSIVYKDGRYSLTPIPRYEMIVSEPGERLSTLDLSADSCMYMAQSGDDIEVKYFNPKTQDVTDSAEGWSWNAATKTLTLSGANIDISKAPAQDNPNLPTGTVAGIILPDGATLNVDKTKSSTVNVYVSEKKNYGIVYLGRDTIKGSGTGSGKLAVTVGEGEAAYECTAIYGYQKSPANELSLTMESGDYSIILTNVTSGSAFGIYADAGNIYLKGSQTVIDSSESICLEKGSLYFLGGSYTLTGVVEEGYYAELKNPTSKIYATYGHSIVSAEIHYTDPADGTEKNATEETDAIKKLLSKGCGVSLKQSVGYEAIITFEPILYAGIERTDSSMDDVIAVAGQPSSGAIKVKPINWTGTKPAGYTVKWFVAGSVEGTYELTTKPEDITVNMGAVTDGVMEYSFSTTAATLPGQYYVQFTSTSDLKDQTNYVEFSIKSFKRTQVLDLSSDGHTINYITGQKGDGTYEYSRAYDPATQDIDASTEGWMWDHVNHVLTLKNLDLEVDKNHELIDNLTHVLHYDDPIYSAIILPSKTVAPNGVTIVVAPGSENRVVLGDDSEEVVTGGTLTREIMIYAPDNVLTIKNKGSLYCTADIDASFIDGINAGKVIFDNDNITAGGETYIEVNCAPKPVGVTGGLAGYEKAYEVRGIRLTDEAATLSVTNNANVQIVIDTDMYEAYKESGEGSGTRLIGVDAGEDGEVNVDTGLLLICIGDNGSIEAIDDAIVSGIVADTINISRGGAVCYANDGNDNANNVAYKVNKVNVYRGMIASTFCFDTTFKEDTVIYVRDDVEINSYSGITAAELKAEGGKKLTADLVPTTPAGLAYIKSDMQFRVNGGLVQDSDDINSAKFGVATALEAATVTNNALVGDEVTYKIDSFKAYAEETWVSLSSEEKSEFDKLLNNFTVDSDGKFVLNTLTTTPAGVWKIILRPVYSGLTTYALTETPPYNMFQDIDIVVVIDPADLATDGIVFYDQDGNEIPYDGTEKTFTSTLTYAGKTLVPEVDYILTENTATDVSPIDVPYMAKFEGIGNFTGEIERPWMIVPAGTVIINRNAQGLKDLTYGTNYTHIPVGSITTADFNVPEGGRITFEARFAKKVAGEYVSVGAAEGLTVTLTDNYVYIDIAPTTDAGDYRVYVKGTCINGTNRTTGEGYTYFTIERRLLSTVRTAVDHPTNSFVQGNVYNVTYALTHNRIALVDEVDYEVVQQTVSANAPGTYSIVLNGIGNYMGTATLTWSVIRLNGGDDNGGSGTSNDSGYSGVVLDPIIVAPTNTEPEKYTVPVTGKDTVRIETEIEKGKAEVSEITKKDIDKVEGTDTIKVDLSGAKEKVTAVVFEKATLETLADAVNDKSSKTEKVEVVMDKATIRMDGTVLDAIADQAKGSKIELVVEEAPKEILTVAQEDTLKDLNVQKTFDAYIESNGQRITTFNDGLVELELNVNLKSGMDLDHVFVLYVAPGGATTTMKTWAENGKITFKTPHLSVYTVVYDESKVNENAELKKNDFSQTVSTSPILTMNKTLYVGKTFAIDMTNVGKKAMVSYSSSNESVATVSDNGVITAKKAGKTTICALIIQNGSVYKAILKVTVKAKGWNYTGLTEKAVKAGEGELPMLNIYKVVNKGKSTTLDITGIEKNAVVSFESEDKKIATVDDKGKITGKAKGFTAIVATVKQNGHTYQYRVVVRVSDGSADENVDSYLVK